jgi:ATP-dependent DNA helicase RecQ
VRDGRLLAYFGQDPSGANCGNCDTCLNPPESWDGTVPAQKLLSTVYRLQKERGQKFGAGQSIDILLGKRTDKIAQFRHAELSVFGIGADLREAEWRGVVRQLLAAGYLAVEPEYGALVLTEASPEVLRGSVKVMMRREVTVKASRPARARGGPAAAAAAADFPAAAMPLFEHLRAWRAATAKEQSVPAYVIFHDATLRAIAALRPTSLAQLGTVSGVGQGKLAKFGQQVLDALAEAPAAPGDTGGSRFEPSPAHGTGPGARAGSGAAPGPGATARFGAPAGTGSRFAESGAEPSGGTVPEGGIRLDPRARTGRPVVPAQPPGGTARVPAPARGAGGRGRDSGSGGRGGPGGSSSLFDFDELEEPPPPIDEPDYYDPGDEPS